MAKTGEARAFGSALLGAIYRDLGGDGKRNVRFDAKKAAQICTGDAQPGTNHTKYVRELLHQLVDIELIHFTIRHDTDFEEFVIVPRQKVPTRKPTTPDEAHG